MHLHNSACPLAFLGWQNFQEELFKKRKHHKAAPQAAPPAVDAAATAGDTAATAADADAITSTTSSAGRAAVAAAAAVAAGREAAGGPAGVFAGLPSIMSGSSIDMDEPVLTPLQKIWSVIKSFKPVYWQVKQGRTANRNRISTWQAWPRAGMPGP